MYFLFSFIPKSVHWCLYYRITHRNLLYNSSKLHVWCRLARNHPAGLCFCNFAMIQACTYLNSTRPIVTKTCQKTLGNFILKFIIEQTAHCTTWRPKEANRIKFLLKSRKLIRSDIARKVGKTVVQALSRHTESGNQTPWVMWPYSAKKGKA